MDNRRAIIWAGLAAVLAAVFYYLSIEKAVDNRVGNRDQTTNIIIARQDIPVGTVVDPTMLDIRGWPQDFLPPGAINDPRAVVGQEAVATVRAGEPILETKFLPKDEISLDRRVAKGKRAITIGIRDDQDVVGVGGLIKPGHYIDILLTLFVSTKEVEKGPLPQLSGLANSAALKAETRTIFQRVKILAVGKDFRIPTAGIDRSNSGRAPLTTKNVTLEMDPTSVQKLVLAQQVGRITLALRPPNDTDIEDLDYMDSFKAFKIKLPVVQGPPPAYKEIRGGQVFATQY